jgi:hypothetical protein
MVPSELPVIDLSTSRLPRSCLAVVHVVEDRFEALIVDIETGSMHSVVVGTTEELPQLTARVASGRNPRVGAVCFVPWSPTGEVIIQIDPRPPIGGGGPHGFPVPPLFNLASLLNRLF